MLAETHLLVPDGGHKGCIGRRFAAWSSGLVSIGYRHAVLHRNRHIDRHSVLFLPCNARCGGAGQIQCEASGNDGQFRLRTHLSRAHEYARMDADFSGAAVALRNLPQRHRCSSARTCLDRRACFVLCRLQQRRGEALARVLHPIDGVPVAVHRCNRGHRHAPFRRLIGKASRATRGRARHHAGQPASRRRGGHPRREPAPQP